MAAPVRGTQSFVTVMVAVWQRPALSALEILWRWLIGALILVPLCLHTGADWLRHPEELRTWATLTLHGGYIYAPQWRILIPAALGLFLLWNLAAALGRTVVLHHLDPQLRARRITLFALGTLRAALLLATWALFFRAALVAAKIAQLTPSTDTQFPNLVLFAAMLIPGTLVLYVAWAIVSWPLQLAPLLAMRNNTGTLPSLRAAVRTPKLLRGKLLEINLVMCIVRIALIVLAMVLSASPLAFQSVATQLFFVIWWSVAILLYLAFSDYFHVVRAAAYLTLHAALRIPPTG
jgi:hypothetical protein